MNVIIGIDPHKATHTAVAFGCDEAGLASVTVRVTKQQSGGLVEMGQALQEAHLGHRVRRRSRLTVGPAARRCRAARHRRAGDPGLECGCLERQSLTRTIPNDVRSVDIAAL